MILEQICSRVPPTRMRMLARTGHGVGTRPLSYAEIAAASGLARSTVVKLLNRPTWEDIGIRTYDALARACGVNPNRTETHRKLIRRGNLAHIDNAAPAQRRMFARILGVSGPGRGNASVPEANPDSAF